MDPHLKGPRSQEGLRWFSSWKTATEAGKNEAVHVLSAFGQDLKKSLEGFRSNQENWFNKAFVKHPKWWKKGAILGAAVISWNFLSSSWNRLQPQENKAIPDYYDRRYDIIKEQMTDFGSPIPIKLFKTASKVIMPYTSSGRRALKTTTGAVRAENIALFNSRHAIGHTRY